MTFYTILITALLSLAPISELRGGIPFALMNGMHPIFAYLMCVGLNLCISPIVYIFMNTVHRFFLRFNRYNRFSERFLERARNKVEQKIKKYGYLGLTVFVAIPLPVTGAYTGTLGAWVLGLDKKKTFLAVSLGVIIAGGLIMLAYWLTSTGLDFFRIFYQEQHA